MSYKTEFQSNNADLQAILDTVNSLPDKVVGPEKCTITVSGVVPTRIVYLKVAETSVESVNMVPTSQPVTLPDVLCSSWLYVEHSYNTKTTQSTSGGCTRYSYNASQYKHVYTAPSTAGAVGTITFTST